MFRFDGEPDAQVAVKPVVIDHALGVAVVVLQVDILVTDFRQPESGVHLEIRIQIPAAPFNDEHRKAEPLVTGLVGSGDLSVAGVADDVRIVRQRERDPEFGLYREMRIDLVNRLKGDSVPAARPNAVAPVRFVFEL